MLHFRSYSRMPFGFAAQRGRVGRSMLQRQCACGTRTDGAAECAECAEKDKRLQRKARPGAFEAVPGIVYDVLRRPGQPLDEESRSHMESQFDYDFSRVRIHSDPEAERSAEATNADAYTVGHDIVFAAGRYAPATEGGKRLLAHELAHVVQQDSSTTETPAAIPIGKKDEHEIAADEMAASAVGPSGSTPHIDMAAPLQLQAKDNDATANANAQQAAL